jgi:uncharacterized membrane-anchored protein YjiN (DUF445 family)
MNAPINVSLLSNLIAAAIAAAAFLVPEPWHGLLLDTGLYALSGGLTNWLAVYMLFERVPLMYGSGVILNRFESFKATLHDMMMQEFFRDDHVQSFLKSKTQNLSLDKDKIFDHLADAITESSFGTMLSLMGGKKALEPLREPVKEKIQAILDDLMHNQTDPGHPENVRSLISELIDNRLNQLTPVMVKDLVHRMIHKHLGWLVIWGAVTGGIMGILAHLLGA